MTPKLIVALIATLFLAASYASAAPARKSMHHKVEKGQAYDSVGHSFRDNNECWACNPDI